MIKDALNKILRGENLSVDESRMAIENIMDGEVSQVVTSSFLTALRCKGETVEEILGAARAMRSRVRRIPHNQSDLFDNCGTGETAPVLSISRLPPHLLSPAVD